MDPANLGPSDLGALGFAAAPRRVVSLVPSATESLFELGAGGSLVGITDYCLYPVGPLAGLRRIGGPQTPNLQLIRDLQPDLVIANREENRKEDVEALQAAGLKVWVTFPRTVRATLDWLWAVVELFRVPQMGLRLSVLETSVEWASLAAANQVPVRVFCPIWRDPPAGPAGGWMTFNQDTYSHDLLRICGGENVFAGRARRYPLETDLGAAPSEPPGVRDTRYPRVRLEEVAACAPDVILLPSEPFPFTAADRAAFEAFPTIPAVKNNRIYLVEGSLLAWPGTRLALALAELPSQLQAEATGDALS